MLLKDGDQIRSVISSNTSIKEISSSIAGLRETQCRTNPKCQGEFSASSQQSGQGQLLKLGRLRRKSSDRERFLASILGYW